MNEMDILQKKREVWAKFMELCPMPGNRTWLRFNTRLEMIDGPPFERHFSIAIPNLDNRWDDSEGCLSFDKSETWEEGGEDAKWHIAMLLLPPAQQSITELREQVIAGCRRRLGDKEEVVLPDGVILSVRAFNITIDRFVFDIPGVYPTLKITEKYDFWIYDSDEWPQTAKLRMAKTLLGI